jgi:hypothetical protein
MEDKRMKWKEELVETVWRQARLVPEADATVWRQDVCGAWIRRDQFGHEDAEFGWTIENVSGGGADTPQNLRAFHVRNHFEQGGQKPHCHATADRTGVPAGEYVTPPRNRFA